MLKFHLRLPDNSRQAAILLFCGTLLLQLTFLILARNIIPSNTGTTEYQAIAAQLAHGNGFVLEAGGEPILWRPPLYIYLLSIFERLFSEPYLKVVFFQILLNAGTCVMLYLLGERLFDRKTGFWAGALLAVYPLFFYNAMRLMPESLYAFWVMLILYFSLDLFKRTNRPAALGVGVLLGLATLTKASIQFLPLLYICTIPFFRKERPKQIAILVNSLIAGVVMILIVLPWSIRNYQVSKEIIFLDTSGGYTFWVGNRIESDGLDDDPLTREAFIEIKKDIARILGLEYTPGFDLSKTAWKSAANSSKLYRAGITSILQHPFATFYLWLKKLFRFWFSYVGGNPYLQRIIFVLQLFLLIAGTIGAGSALKSKKEILPVLILVSYFILLHMASTANVRYCVPIIPAVILFALHGIFSFKSKKI